MALLCAASLAGVSAQRTASWPPSVRNTPEKAPVLSAEEEMKTMVLRTPQNTIALAPTLSLGAVFH